MKYGPTSQYEFSAMTPIERTVTGLWDAGASIEQIALELDRTRSMISGIVSRLDENGERRSERTMMGKGSEALLVALRGSADA